MLTNSKMRLTRKSILLVDDDSEALKLYGDLLEAHGFRRISTTKYPTQALQLATERFYDLIVMDVTMAYNGTPFGGFELYKSLLDRYGDSSLLAYSQFINDDLLKQYNYSFNFIEISGSTSDFGRALASKMKMLTQNQTCFVAMPFSISYEPVFKVIDTCIQRAGYKTIRIDQVAFTHSIVDKILDSIRRCKCMVFLATDQNPNAFYECGYAVALNKEVVTVTDEYANLPFDVRDRHAIQYGTDLAVLGKALGKLLLSLSGDE